MLRIAIVIGSTRPGRQARDVGEWVLDRARSRGDADYQILDLADFDLPLLDEPGAAAMTQDYAHPHTRAWSEAVASFDGYVFVTPEYNHSTTAALKNALDYLFVEWNNKAAGFVGYGLQGGVRAVEHLRLIVAELHVADVRSQVALSLFHDFSAHGLRPQPHHEQTLQRMLDQLLTWAGALRAVRGLPQTEDPVTREAAAG
ncbi:NAD(P)H-dependent oxidoreductase [Blastococcus sp. MG754426]|uniref:NADPH-dependent FMN reductase n=1 Tax=unclassified Blastococcus TaxID=2619396 RepID=UPI001EEF7DAC|nr:MULTISPECIES: NAD(P)H-dependent oxidoreductase [unclassified Blastococcus]MCF6509350.1 NAD(P)H-dependent oxidoreductase [Blastococcus sp. MG754426]MCF6513892.1 NAD(P)H-dependent oxidoreductase [Blastococcus sp. MG754427]